MKDCILYAVTVQLIVYQGMRDTLYREAVARLSIRFFGCGPRFVSPSSSLYLCCRDSVCSCLRALILSKLCIRGVTRVTGIKRGNERAISDGNVRPPLVPPPAKNRPSTQLHCSTMYLQYKYK